MKILTPYLLALFIVSFSFPASAHHYPERPISIEPETTEARATAEADNGRVRAVAIAIAQVTTPYDNYDNQNGYNHNFYDDRHTYPDDYQSYYGNDYGNYNSEHEQWMPYSYSYDPSYYDNYPQHDPYYPEDRFYNPVIVPDNYDTNDWNPYGYPITYGADPAPWYDSWRYYVNPRHWLSPMRNRQPAYPYTEDRIIPIHHDNFVSYYDPTNQSLYYPQGFNYTPDFERKLVVKQVIKRGDERHIKKYVYKTNVN